MLVFNEQLSVGQINLAANYLSTEYDLPFAYQTNLFSAGVGDHNADGVVDAADYVVWRRFNTNGSQGYDDWRSNFGNGLGSGSSAQVPEPAAWIMIVIGTVAVGARRSYFNGTNN